MDPEIIRGVQWNAPGAEEPKLTVSELRSLLQAAAELERAQRPIVLQESPRTVTATTWASDLRGPVPPPACPVVTASVDRSRNIWPLAFMVSGCVGLAACATAAATGSQFAILAFFAAVAVWGTATYKLVFDRN